MIDFLEQLKNANVLERAASQSCIKSSRYGNRKKKKPVPRVNGINKWKKKIKDKDGEMCLVCHELFDLQVHHIYSYHANPEMRLDIENGVTMCKKCHKEFHKMFGMRDNNYDQWISFLELKDVI